MSRLARGRVRLLMENVATTPGEEVEQVPALVSVGKERTTPAGQLSSQGDPDRPRLRMDYASAAQTSSLTCRAGSLGTSRLDGTAALRVRRTAKTLG